MPQVQSRKRLGLSVDAFYEALPVWAQHTAVTAYGLYWYWLRFGPGYRRALNFYLAHERFTSKEWVCWLQQQLVQLLSDAAEHVPYYRNTWSKHEKEAAQCGELSALPLLDKGPVRGDPTAFLRLDKALVPRFTFHTSGSTGTPIATYWSAEEMRKSMAVREARSTGWAGVSFRLARATFSGRMVEPEAESYGPFYRFNAIEKQVYLSAFHVRPDTAKDYVHALRRHQVRWCTGYAVSYYLLARFILETGLPPLHLDAVITTSEKLTPHMRDVMSQAYGCRIYEEYGTVENCLFASECEAGRLHVSPDVGIIEILRSDGSACEPGEIGEVVATSLLRTHHILIRYRVGDLACWDSEACPCGREMPVIKDVIGRLEDIVVGRDGRRLVRFHSVFTDQPNVKEGQVVQKSADHLVLRIVGTRSFSEYDRRSLIARTERRIGPGVKVEVEQVDTIPRTNGGKFKAVLSLLPPEQGGSGRFIDSETGIVESGVFQNTGGKHDL
ncbi:MAG TPA: hypothetical protein VF283_13160 [Bryobacteraceae bacterium]